MDVPARMQPDANSVDLGAEPHGKGSIQHTIPDTVFMRHLDGHADFCKRMKRSSFTMPWERGLLGHEVMPAVRSWVHKGAFPVVDGQQQLTLDPFQATGAAAALASSFKSSVVHDVMSKLSKGITWKQQLDSSRALALKKWYTILTEGKMDFSFIEQHFAVRPGDLLMMIDSIELAFTGKSTATLHGRAGPVLRYMKFCKDGGVHSFPLDAVVFFKFLESNKDSCAPTFPRSLLGSVAFMKYSLGLKSADAILESTLISGLCRSLFLKKRKTLQRPPLKVWQVRWLEEIACGIHSHSIFDQVAAGFFCYLVYARARFSDGQASGDRSLDLVANQDPPKGFIEAAVYRSKTSFSLERKTRHLPMVAQIRGLAEDSWAICWKQTMDKAGLNIGPGLPLLPAPVKTGQWDAVPISAEAATNWIRKLLLTYPRMTEIDRSHIMSVGTHSCKTTILSWAAKKGTDIKMRKLMGYHSIGKQDPVFIYGRDNVAPVLREIEAIVQMISDEIFMPDVTRSGYFKTDEEQPERILEEPSLQDLRGDSSSEDSADEDNVEHKLCEDAVKDTVGDWYGDLDCDSLPPNAELYMRHSVSRVSMCLRMRRETFSHVADQFRFRTKSLKRCQKFCTQFASSVLRCFGKYENLTVQHISEVVTAQRVTPLRSSAK